MLMIIEPEAFQRSHNEQATKLLVSIDFLNDSERNKTASINEFDILKSNFLGTSGSSFFV